MDAWLTDLDLRIVRHNGLPAMRELTPELADAARRHAAEQSKAGRHRKAMANETKCESEE